MRLIPRYKDKKFVQSFIIILMFQFFFEIYLFYKSSKNNHLYGDFYLYDIEKINLDVPIILSLFSLTVYFLFLYAYLIFSKKNSNYPVGTNNYILFIFFIYFLIFMNANMGFTSSTKTYFGILISILPPTFLIIFLSLGKWNAKYLICFTLFILMYYLNGVLSAVLAAAWIIYFKFQINIKKILLILILFPFLLVFLNQIIVYKFEKRDGAYALNQNILENHLLARFSINQNLTYININKRQISQFCSKNNYLNQYEAALYQVIPKKIFNIDNPSTLNNCVLDFYLGKKSSNSSIKTSLVGNIVLLMEGKLKKGINYIFFISLLITINAYLTNLLLGKEGVIYLSYILYVFFIDGSIGILSHSIFFLIVILIYFILMKPFFKYSYD